MELYRLKEATEILVQAWLEKNREEMEKWVSDQAAISVYDEVSIPGFDDFLHQFDFSTHRTLSVADAVDDVLHDMIDSDGAKVFYGAIKQEYNAIAARIRARIEQGKQESKEQENAYIRDVRPVY